MKACLKKAKPFIIRQATAADIPAIALIEQQAQISPWSEKQFLDSFSGQHFIWVVEGLPKLSLNNSVQPAEIILAYLVVMPVCDEWELLNLVVAPLSQRQGIGQCCLEYLFEQAELSEIQRILLEVRQSNIAAIALYENFGFEINGLRKAYYPAADGREDALIMQKELAKAAENPW